MEVNVRQNNLSNNVNCHNLALSDENKEGYLSAGYRFGKYQSGGAKVSPLGEIKIKQVRGDDIIKDSNNVIAIKIDVEGFELSVLRGFVNLIKNNKVFFTNRNF